MTVCVCVLSTYVTCMYICLGGEIKCVKVKVCACGEEGGGRDIESVRVFGVNVGILSEQ